MWVGDLLYRSQFDTVSVSVGASPRSLVLVAGKTFQVNISLVMSYQLADSLLAAFFKSGFLFNRPLFNLFNKVDNNQALPAIILFCFLLL